MGLRIIAYLRLGLWTTSGTLDSGGKESVRQGVRDDDEVTDSQVRSLAVWGPWGDLETVTNRRSRRTQEGGRLVGYLGGNWELGKKID